ncbi:MAG: Eco57I restriction-modification methylase domain-containing protein [Paludibacter sp.]|nr:Eco57I restriction-modification methylase domain-containing protein [Paludibacter sp.]
MEDFKTFFEHDYQGINAFVEKIIIPVFGNNFATNDEDILHSNPNYKAAADRANIVSIKRFGTCHNLDVPMDFFDITLSESVRLAYSRVSIQALVRQLMETYSAALIVFHYPDNKGDWRVSYVSKGSNVTDSTTARRYTYLLGKNQTCRTAALRFEELKKDEKTHENITSAFSVEKLSDDFFEKYRDIYADFVQFITGKRYEKEKGKWVENIIKEPDEQLNSSFEGNEKVVRDYVKKMLGRLVFLQFLQKKGWLGVPLEKAWGEGDQHFLQNLFKNSEQQDDFLDAVLEPLLFETLNDGERPNEIAHSSLGENIKIPYLNGGLFERDDLDKKRVIFPAYLFARLFQFFSEFNFTIDENDPNDAEVGVDPEMLGRIFENLLEDNKDKGAFYTPKEIVQYMCRESLIAYLTTDNEDLNKPIKELVLQHNTEQLKEEQKLLLDRKLKEVKVCDPAIGSGAFPMGMLNEIYKCRIAIEGKTENAVDIKKHIIQQSIYGVDIEKGAVDIARLRFWLALVVDEEKPQPLPNLDYKIMQGDSLIEKFEGVDLSKITIKNNKETLKDLFGNIVNPQMTLSWTEDEQKQDDILLSMRDYFNTNNHDKKDELRQQIDKQISEYIISYCSGNMDIALKVNKLNLNKKPFFLWHLYFADVFSSIKNGFDIVIGNPPYVEAKKLKTISSKLKNYEVYSGTADLSLYFFEKGLNLCTAKGYLCYISTNKFFNTGYGKPLRGYLLKNKIEQMINFEQVEVFDKVLVSSVICGISKKEPKKTNKFIYKKFYKLKHKEFKKKFLEGIENPTFYKQSNLDANEWSFADNVGLSLKLKIENSAKVLKKVEGIIVNRGVTTGFNPAFIIDNVTKENFSNKDTSSESIIKTLLQGRNVRKWYFNKSTENLIFTKQGIDIDLHKPIKEHLFNYFEDLNPRTEDDIDSKRGRKPGSYKWYEIQDNTAYYKEFEVAEKIIWGLTADKWAFAYDAEQHYLPSNGYILTSKTIPIKYLLAILNSNLMKYYFGFIGIMTAGGAYTLKHATILQLPIKIANNQNKFIEIVDEILLLKNQNIEHETFKQELELDAYVYKLYELTYAEVKTVDPEFGLSEEEYAALKIE